jgi:hypothetical protein
VQRLDAEGIAGQVQLAGVAVVQREGVHAAHPRQHPGQAPLAVAVQDDLAVAPAQGTMARGLELAPQREVVVDLAVVHERQAALAVVERVVAAATSMIESRRWPSATPPSSQKPSASGPRWAIEAFMRRSTAPSGAGAPGREARPQMPHT